MRRAPAWAIFISGRGSNLGALLDARPEMDIRLCVSSSSEAYGLLRAKRAGIPTMLTPYQAALPNKKPRIDWAELDRILRSKNITHIFLAGFMKVVPATFVQAWEERIVNLHPSLLPAYPGLNSIERAFTERAAVGLTVHEVNEEVDAGKILLQRRCLPAQTEYGLFENSSTALNLDQVELLVHIDEQRLVKKAASTWPKRFSSEELK